MPNGLEAIDSMLESIDAALTAGANQFDPNNSTPQELADLETASQLSNEGQALSDLNSDFNELVLEYNEAGEARGELQDAREEFQEAREDVQDARTRYRETRDSYRSGDVPYEAVQEARDVLVDALDMRTDARETRNDARETFEEERSEFYDMKFEFKQTIREAERNGVDTTELRDQFDQFTRDFAPFEAQPMPGDANGDLVVDGTDATGGVGDVSDLPPGVETVAGWISDFIDAAREEMMAKGDQFDGKEFAEGYDYSQFAGEDPVLVETFLEQLQAMSDRPLDLPNAAEITGQDLGDYMPSGDGSSSTDGGGSSVEDTPGSTGTDDGATPVPDASPVSADGAGGSDTALTDFLEAAGVPVDQVAGESPDVQVTTALFQMLINAGGDPSAMDFSAIQQAIADGILNEAQFEAFRGIVSQQSPDLAAQLPSFDAIASGQLTDTSSTGISEMTDE